MKLFALCLLFLASITWGQVQMTPKPSTAPTPQQLAKSGSPEVSVIPDLLIDPEVRNWSRAVSKEVRAKEIAEATKNGTPPPFALYCCWVPSGESCTGGEGFSILCECASWPLGVCNGHYTQCQPGRCVNY